MSDLLSKVTVLGAGRSGQAATALALAQGAHEVVLTVRHVFGVHDEADLTQTDLVVLSPGIPAKAAPVKLAQAAGVEVIGELGFAARYLPKTHPILAITGTNGKSTVTHFLFQILASAGMKTFAGGNLGTPLSAAVGQGFQVLAVEVSSYQLELPGDFSPWAAVILNLSPDHLARHGDMAGYAQAKARIFDGLRPTGLAGMPHQEHLEMAAKGKPGRRVWLDGVDVDQPVLDSLRVLGSHNRWNAAVAMLLAAQVGVVPHDLSTLQGLPHRLEPVPSRDHRVWINDSKATNVEAAHVGISALKGPGVVLLGGQGKGGADYGMLKGPISGRPVICFGQAGPEIHAVLGGELVATMEQAVARAQQVSLPGESILLSPACSSFDAFDNFEQRGRIFARLVQELS
jgi:UDP-N-acetylmuramoylalanine--D-glutamate ligase